MLRASLTALGAGAAVNLLFSCGEAYSEDGAPHAVFDPKPIDFGVAGCGANAPPADQKFILANDGAAPLTWSAALEDSITQFSVRGAASGTIAPGANAEIAIGSLAIGANEAAGATKQTILNITTNDPQAPSISTPVHITAGGGALEIVPQTLSFGESPVTVPTMDVPITIRNSGTLPITVSIDPPQNPQFFIAGLADGPTLLAPEASIPNLVGKFTPTAKGDHSTTAAIKVEGPVCGSPPAAITLNGTGASGTVAVQPSLIDYGSVACGTTPAGGGRSITLFNVGTDPFIYQALPGKGVASNFTVTPQDGTVAAGAAATLTVTAKIVPSTGGASDNLYGDVVTVTTNAMGDKPHPVTIRLTPSGAVYTATPPSISFGSVNTNGAGVTRTVVLKNEGNYAASISLATAGAGAFDLLTASPMTVQPGATGAASIRCKPGSNGVKTGTLNFSAGFFGSRYCKPAPPAIQLDCRGI